jgi:UDP-3-O-[3-hydroxymyristoyl] glucosamine N-acyltransferase
MRHFALISMLMLPALPAFAGDNVDCHIKREKDDRVARGSDVVVAAGDKVHDAIAINGNVVIKAGAHVRNAMAVGGNVTVEDGAQVDGDVAVVKGAAKVGPKATVKGSRFELNGDVKVEGEALDVHLNGANLTEKVTTAVLDELKNCKIE